MLFLAWVKLFDQVLWPACAAFFAWPSALWLRKQPVHARQTPYLIQEIGLLRPYCKRKQLQKQQQYTTQAIEPSCPCANARARLVLPRRSLVVQARLRSGDSDLVADSNAAQCWVADGGVAGFDTAGEAP